MNEEYQKVLQEYSELEKKLGSPEFLSSTMQNEVKKIGERFSLLSKIRENILEWQKISKDLTDSEELLQKEQSEDMKQMLRGEREALSTKKDTLEKIIHTMLHPDPDAAVKKVILEIRAGAGGDEAALFAGQLFRMYQKFADKRGWVFSVINSSPTSIGGYKEIIAEIEGDGIYQKLRQEMGVHRVQRIPDTEKNGRVHTSTISVAIMPEAEEVDIEINPQDITVEFYRSSGPGGQNVNKVETAVRIIHKPTGLIVTSQEGRSQLKNRERAMSLLRTRLLDAKRQEEDARRAADRKEQIGTADRSEKIRTYNFPQDRITDHRIKESWHNIETILEGNMDPIIDAFQK